MRAKMMRYATTAGVILTLAVMPGGILLGIGLLYRRMRKPNAVQPNKERAMTTSHDRTNPLFIGLCISIVAHAIAFVGITTAGELQVSIVRKAEAAVPSNAVPMETEKGTVQELDIAAIDEEAWGKIFVIFLNPTLVTCERRFCAVEIKTPDGRWEERTMGPEGDYRIASVFLPGDWVTVLAVR